MDQAKIEIVKLPVLEWSSYKALRLRALKEEPQAFGSRWDDQSMYADEYWQERLATSKHMLFAKLDGQLVGMMCSCLSDLDVDKTSADIVSVFVVREARGRGISKILMQNLLKELKEDGITKVNLTVNKDQLAAINLYQSFGFFVTGEEENLMGDGLKHIELLMSKQL